MNRTSVYPVLTLAVMGVLWEVAVRLLDIPLYLIPAPSDIWVASLQNFDTLMAHSWITLGEIMAGFALSIAIGLPLAIAIVYSRVFEQILYPLVVACQSVPKIAVAPLFVVWLGFGTVPKVLVAFLVAFFPVVIFSVIGLESADREMLQLVRSMGARQWDVFAKVRFPNAMPSIFGGLKVAITLAVIGAIVGEFVGSNAGLGYLLMVATGNLDTPVLFAAIVYLTLMGVVLFYAVDFVGRLVMPWYSTSKGVEPAGAIT